MNPSGNRSDNPDINDAQVSGRNPAVWRTSTLGTLKISRGKFVPAQWDLSQLQNWVSKVNVSHQTNTAIASCEGTANIRRVKGSRQFQPQNIHCPSTKHQFLRATSQPIQTRSWSRTTRFSLKVNLLPVPNAQYNTHCTKDAHDTISGEKPPHYEAFQPIGRLQTNQVNAPLTCGLIKVM